MQLTKQDGWAFAHGVSNWIGFLIIIGWAVSMVIRLIIPTDSSDSGKFDRSGLNVHRDAETGIEYLSTSSGGLTPRLKTQP